MQLFKPTYILYGVISLLYYNSIPRDKYVMKPTKFVHKYEVATQKMIKCTSLARKCPNR